MAKEIKKQVETENVADATSKNVAIATLDGKTIETVVRSANRSGNGIALIVKDDVYYQLFDPEANELLDSAATCHVIRTSRVTTDCGGKVAFKVDRIFRDIAAYRDEHHDDESGKTPIIPDFVFDALKGASIEVTYYVREDEDGNDRLVNSVIVTNIVTDFDDISDEWDEYREDGLKPYIAK